MSKRDVFSVYNSRRLRQRVDDLRARAVRPDGNPASRTDIIDYAVQILEEQLRERTINLPSPSGNGEPPGE